MINQILSKLGYSCDTSMQEHMQVWQSWYEGYVETFHKYKVYNGKAFITRVRDSLRMPKRVCEDWADMLLNEKVVINVGDDTINKRIKQVLTANDFYVQGNQLIEKAFALGTAALVEYADANGNPVIDYITGDMIYPISWSGTRITECAFASEKTVNGVEAYYINIHTKNNLGNYVIQNRLFKKTDGTALDMSGVVEGIIDTGSPNKRFQIITPNIANNIEKQTPMGISVFANAVAEMKGIDLVYDSYINEFRLGKKRILIPVTALQTMKEEDGVSTPVFDYNDTEFYALPGMPDGEQFIKEMNMELRSNEHKEALEVQLNMFSDACGMGEDQYQFQSSGGVKTAREVISENSKLFRTLKKHEIVLKSALISLITALLEIMNIKNELDTVIEFDDSIIEDTDTEFNRRLQMVSVQAMKPWELRAWQLNETEEEAKKALEGAESDDIFEE
ncbi:MAG: phage portal protein [Clostridia bacterium]|nr:phage portal protein [Clostridia bacterium]